MGTVTAGRGVGDSMDGAYSGYTVVDRYYPAASTFTVTQIKILFDYISGGYELVVGCGTLSGTTFTPRHYVEFDTTGWESRFPTGLATLNAPADFPAFEIQAGDLCYVDDEYDEFSITNAATPEGLGYTSYGYGKDASFSVTLNTTETLQIQFSGPGAAKGGRILMVGVG